MGDRLAGWYPDPMTVGAARYWDGRAWTSHISYGGVVRRDPTPLAEVTERAERQRREVILRYLDDAVERDVVAPERVAMLRADALRTGGGAAAPMGAGMALTAERGVGRPLGAGSRAVEQAGGRPPTADRPVPITRPSSVLRPPTPPAPTPGPALRPTQPWATPPPTAGTTSTASPVPTERPLGSSPTVTTPPEPTPATLRPIPAEPGRLASWWADTSTAVKSDLALHGLAYLGVLLLFTGVTGLVVFSFGSVAPWVRSLTELVVPLSLLVSGRYLTQRDASVVGGALTALGGAILPIVVAASLTDDAPFPPDLEGVALPIAQGLAVAVVAVAMAVATVRRPATPLRFLVAPTAWLAVGLTAGAVNDPIHQGYEAVRASPLQLAAIVIAIAATAFVLRIPAAGEHPLGRATRHVVLPAAGIVYVLELIVAGGNGWPVASTVLAALGLCVVAEAGDPRLTHDRIAIVELLAIGVGALRLGAQFEPHWVAVGTAIVLLLLLERTGGRGAHPAVIVAVLAAAGMAFATTWIDPDATIVAFSVLTGWGLWRHLDPPTWAPFRDPWGVLPVGAAAVVTGTAWDLAPDGSVMTVAAIVVAVAAVAGRLWPAVRNAILWRWFVPSAAITLATTTAGYGWGQVSTARTATLLLSATAIALSALPVVARLWATTALAAWGAASLADQLDVATPTRLIVLGSLGLAAVLGALADRRPIAPHVAAIGHLAGLTALALSTEISPTTAVLAGLATVGWLTTAIVDDRTGAVQIDGLRRILETSGPDELRPADAAAALVVDHVAPLLSMVGVAGTAVLAADAAGWTAVDAPASAIVVGATAAATACIGRFVPLRRVRADVLSWTALAFAVGATTSILSSMRDRDDWWLPASVAIVAFVVAVHGAPRPRPFAWFGWSACFVETVLVADRIGIPRSWLDVVAAGWGAGTVIALLGMRRATGRSVSPPDVIADRTTAAPAILGAIALTIGGILGLSDGSQHEIGWTAVGLSAAVTAIAVLSGLGVLVAVAQVLATVAIALLAPWDPAHRAWTWSPWIAVLLLVAFATRRSGARSIERWDLPSFVAAHGVAVLALVTAVSTGGIDATFTSVAALSLIVAAVLRRWEWAAVAAVLLPIGAGASSPGWLAAVLALEGGISTAFGLRRPDDDPFVRWASFALGCALLVSGWFEFTVWVGWGLQTVWLLTVPATAALALASALAWRTAAVPLPLAAVWTIGGTAVSLGTAAFGAGVVDRRPGGVVLALSLVALAAAAAALTTVLGDGMRWVAAALAATAWAPLVWGLDVTAPRVTATGTSVAFAGISALAVVHRRRPTAATLGRWSGPATAWLVLTQLGAAVAALSLLPDRTWTEVVLLAASAELIGLGTVTGSRTLFLVAPTGAFVAGALLVTDAVDGVRPWWIVTASMPAGAAVAGAVAVLLRRRSQWLRTIGTWVVAGALLVLIGAAAFAQDARRLDAIVLAVSLSLLAAAAAALTTVLGDWTRWVTAALAATAWAPLVWGLDVTAPTVTAGGTVVALAGISALVPLRGRRPTSAWFGPATAWLVLTQLGAAGTALSLLPDRTWTEVVLLAASAELLGLGTATGHHALHVAAPPLALTAWLLFASDALRGDANWYTVPVGLTMLTMSGQVRWMRRARGRDTATWEIGIVEVVAMGLLIGSAVARELDGQLWYSLLVIPIGVAIGAWGVVTRVRWRAAFGTLGVVVGVLILLGVPLWQSMTWSGPALWATIAVIGLTAIAIATALERRRDRLVMAVDQLSTLTADWEHLPPIHHGHPSAGGHGLPPPTVSSGGPAPA